MCDLIEMASKYGQVMHKEININLCCNDLLQEGYPVLPSFKDFILKYGGVSGFHAAYRKNGNVERFFIDPSEALQHIFIERVNNYMERCQCKLVPIGECSNGYITLMYGEDDAIYGGSDDYLWRFGGDRFSSLDVIINGREAIEIP